MFSLSLLQGCGGGTERGIFLDNPVEGLQYRTESQNSVTDAEGTFKYRPGESVVFSVGGFRFSSVPAQATITPIELAGTDEIGAPEVVNILRLLQSLDADMDPGNGILIPQSARDNVREPTLSASDIVDIEVIIGDVLFQTYGEERPIVEPAAAVEHLIDTLSSALIARRQVIGILNRFI